MKIYIYRDEEISQFPKFKERDWMPIGVKGVEIVDKPRYADFIICPVALHRFKSANQSLRVDKTVRLGVKELKYWNNYENSHVLFDCSDFEVSLGGTSAILIRCNVRDFMLADKNTIPWYWPVDDLKYYCDIPPDGFKYDASFQGWLSTSIRKDSVNSCKNTLGDRFFSKTFNDFYGHMKNKAAQEQRRHEFLTNQQYSKILLAPESIRGVFPYRFYEAMSSARVPALFCTGYYLPFENEIDWDKCTLRFDAEQAKNAGKLIGEFLDKTSNRRIIEMGKYGRKVWEKWLNRDKQPELIAYVLEQKGKELGLL